MPGTQSTCWKMWFAFKLRVPGCALTYIGKVGPAWPLGSAAGKVLVVQEWRCVLDL